MDKFIYALCNSNKDINKIQLICAKSLRDAEEKIIKNFWDKYEDLNEDDWNLFINELWEKHGILISKDLLEINELEDLI